MFSRFMKGRDFSEAVGLFTDYSELNQQRSPDFQNESVKKNIKKSREIQIAEFLKHPTVFLGVRDRLVSNVVQMAQFYVVAMPPAPEHDPTGLRGETGITGELQAHICQIYAASPLIDLRYLENPSELELIELTHLYSNISCLFSTSWNYVRLKLEGINKPDWYKDFVKIQCAYEEDYFRKLLGLPSLLERDHVWGDMAPLLFSTFQFIAASGVSDPYKEWLKDEKRE